MALLVIGGGSIRIFQRALQEKMFAPSVWMLRNNIINSGSCWVHSNMVHLHMEALLEELQIKLNFQQHLSASAQYLQSYNHHQLSSGA